MKNFLLSILICFAAFAEAQVYRHFEPNFTDSVLQVRTDVVEYGDTTFTSLLPDPGIPMSDTSGFIKYLANIHVQERTEELTIDKRATEIDTSLAYLLHTRDSLIVGTQTAWGQIWVDETSVPFYRAQSIGNWMCTDSLGVVKGPVTISNDIWQFIDHKGTTITGAVAVYQAGELALFDTASFTGLPTSSDNVLFSFVSPNLWEESDKNIKITRN